MERVVFNHTADYEGEVVSSLLCYKSSCEQRKGAILYIHGYIDYFFHDHVAQFFNSNGYDLYAIELRKYGGSFLKHQHFNYCRDLREYYQDIDLSIDCICKMSSLDKIILIGHSTGGLLVSLYSAEGDKRDKIERIILNSPFFELNTSPFNRLITPFVTKISKYFPYISKPNELSTSYFDSISSSRYGEWDFDTNYKPREGVPLYFAWLRAVYLGQRRLQKGLNISCDILVLSSNKSFVCNKWCDDVFSADIVLNVKDIELYANSLGDRARYIAIDGALHDIFLSKKEVREESFNICLDFLINPL